MDGVFRMMEHWEKIWWPLEDRQKKAEKYPLRVLILAPNNPGNAEYEMGCRLREELLSLGHAAVFFEELLCPDDGSNEKLEEIMLQAFEAHLIVVVYAHRQAQGWYTTLLNKILAHTQFMAKSIVIVEKSIYTQVDEMLTEPDWNRISKVAELHVYDKSELPDTIVARVSTITQKIRQQVYVRYLLAGEIS